MHLEDDRLAGQRMVEIHQQRLRAVRVADLDHRAGITALPVGRRKLHDVTDLVGLGGVAQPVQQAAGHPLLHVVLALAEGRARRQLEHLPAAFGQTAAPPATTTRTLNRADVIARHADAASKFVDLDGVRVHYKDEGQGPAILLVHGTFGDLADWDGWVQVLKPRYRVVRLDLPAFGLTGPVPSGN